MRRELDLSVYLVTDRPLCLGRDLEWVVAEAVAGGATLVQLREKDCPVRAFVGMALGLVKLLTPLGVPLLVNDRVDVALAAGAAGVHLGQTDMHARDARRLLGPEAVIGLSVETMDQAREAEGLDVDYYGVSPVFATSTKTDTGAPWGLEGLARLRRATSRPLAAIGGIGPDNAADVTAAGAHGVAVVSAVCSADSPRQAAAALRRAVEQGRTAHRHFAAPPDGRERTLPRTCHTAKEALMFKLNYVQPGKATGVIKKTYDLYPPHEGVPHHAQLYSASPALLASQTVFTRALLDNERMEFPLLTAIRFMAATEFGYDYCVRLNADMLKRAGLDDEHLEALTGDLDALAGSLDDLPFQEHDMIMLKLVKKVITAPASVTDSDIQACRDAGWHDSDILELSALAGSIQLSGRLMTAFAR